MTTTIRMTTVRITDPPTVVARIMAVQTMVLPIVDLVMILLIVEMEKM